MSITFFYALLFITAFLSSAVGHGGASGYLAAMALFGFAPVEMRFLALLLNLFVSCTSFISFYRSGHFIWHIFWPIAIASIPFSFIGGMVAIDGLLYKKILGVLLLIPVFRMLFDFSTREPGSKPFVFWLAPVIGGCLGFISGLIGIGGGILLSPILLALRWTGQKQTAAISAIFIFVNSLAGIIGFRGHAMGQSHISVILVFVSITLAGGIAGGYLGATYFRQNVLKNILATVLMVASLKLLLN